MGRHEVSYSKGQLLAWLQRRFPDVTWDEIELLLPPIIWRSRWDRLADRLGLPYSRKHMANLDSKGEGPKGQATNKRSS